MTPKIPVHKDFSAVLLREMEKNGKMETETFSPVDDRTEFKSLRFSHNDPVGKMLSKNNFLKHFTQLDHETHERYELFTIVQDGKNWKIYYVVSKT